MAESPVRAGPTLLTASSTTVYTAGAASTWSILRSVTVSNEYQQVVTVTLGIGTSNTDATSKHFARVELPLGEVWEWNGAVPLMGHATTPDLIYAYASVASGATVTLGLVSGP